MKNTGFILFFLLLFILLISVCSVTLLTFSQQELHANHVAKTEFQLRYQAEQSLQLLKTHFPAPCIIACNGKLSNNIHYEIKNIRQDIQGNKLYLFNLKIPTSGNMAQLEVIERISIQDQHWQRMNWSYH